MANRVYTQAHASVRFMADQLDPLTITRALRLPPDHLHRDGEPRLYRVRSGRVGERGVYRGGLWSMSSEKWVESPRLAIHLDWLLRQLEPKADAVRALRADGIEADFLCFSLGSTTTPPPLPRLIRERAETLGIEMVIDHYNCY